MDCDGSDECNVTFPQLQLRLGFSRLLRAGNALKEVGNQKLDFSICFIFLL